MFTDIHSLAENLVVIEGRHPTLLWEACDVPSIVVYRARKTLYVLDTGVGPEQRAALKTQMAALGQGAEEIVLINSHGHFDHLGNNDLVQQSVIPRKRHLISKDAAPNTDIRAELFEMYCIEESSFKKLRLHINRTRFPFVGRGSGSLRQEPSEIIC
jgi:glyoxylase-like metal-dependent hydrolase (beta-lactamase superfamily II)